MRSRLEAMGLPGWLILMGALTAIGPLSIDMYLPAFPSIASSLGAHSSEVERTLAAYLLGMASAQLVYGPLADRFGRKPPLYCAMLLYIVASAGCALAPTVEFLTMSRVFQAMGGAAGMVISRAVVRDHYNTQEAARALSMLMLVMGIAPILAPLLGSLILNLVGWRGIFATITFFGIVLLWTLSNVMVESLPRERQIKLSWGNILRTYAGLLAHRRFLAFALSGGFASATMFAYIVGSPRLFIEYFGVSPQTYGLLFGLNASSLILGSQVSARILKHHAPMKILPWALTGMMAAGVSALILALSGAATLVTMMGCMLVFMFCHGFVGPNSAALALSDQGHQLGSASAMMGTLSISCGALAGLLVSLMASPGPIPLALMMAGCTTLACLTGAIARRAASPLRPRFD
ncbi:multidrug effflux MFS transporter [Zwartia sp.]|uniref:multidrug effflux MFS transporter n=1 Tax=Zwartia sp. TaxID=2978004 RepID=UPI002723F884|nr:multidrug effflux MFS transporter [Zwartia sp.]MDO9023898.1 multidrug effflux MFS transporter [Zwartia sp.]